MLALARRRFTCFLDVGPEVAKHFRRALDQAAAGCARLHGTDLLPDVVLIAREAGPEFRDLTSDDESEDGNAQESEHHHGDHRWDSRDPPTAERGNQRREREAEKPGQRERHKDVAPEVECSDDNHQDRQRLKPGLPVSGQNIRRQHRSRRRRVLIHLYPGPSRRA